MTHSTTTVQHAGLHRTTWRSAKNRRGTGLLTDEVTEVTHELKSSFKQTDFYHKAVVFSNRSEEVSWEEVTQLDIRVKSAIYQIDVRRSPSQLVSLFETDTRQTTLPKNLKVHTIRRKMNEMPLNVVLGSLACYDALRFEALKHYFPHLNSTHEFIKSSDYLGETEITFQSDTEDLTASDLRAGLEKVFRAVASYLAGIKVTYRGTHKFEATRLNEVLRNKRLQIANPVEDGIGTSQTNDPDSNRRINLEIADWYVYNDNYGTSEEKSFIKYFSTVVDDLKQHYDEVYLVRNERLAPVALYSFATGERFETDYLLFLRKKDQAYKQQQIYLEPKCTHLLETDKWKKNSCSPSRQMQLPTRYTSTTPTTASSDCRSTTKRTGWAHSGKPSRQRLLTKS